MPLCIVPLYCCTILSLAHLVSSTYVLLAAVQVDALCNVWRLLLKSHKHVASLVVEP